MRRLYAAAIAAILTLVPLCSAFAQQGVPFIPADTVSKRIAVNNAAQATTAAAVATLPANQGRTTYVCGISISPGSATTAINLTVTLTGLLGGQTLTWTIGAPATAAGVTGTPLNVPFTPCQPAAAIDGSIVLTSSALGAGGIGNDANIWGYQVESP